MSRPLSPPNTTVKGILNPVTEDVSPNLLGRPPEYRGLPRAPNRPRGAPLLAREGRRDGEWPRSGTETKVKGEKGAY